jgi:cellulose synthase (UDP-forming)
MTSLPQPPSDEEVYAYFGAQRRWFVVLRAVAAGFVCVSLARFAAQRIPLLPFLIVLQVVVAVAAISLYTSTRRRRLDAEDHRALVAGWRPESYPSVDVLLPSAGEPLELLATRYEYLAALEYPGELNCYVLDDSGRPEVAWLARLSGFHYLCRPNRGELKKAGNLRYGYEHSDGDLILVFDADFAPRRDFLAHLLPYLDDPAVGIVQSPQYFDTTDEQSWLERAAGATQELFYRWVQPSRDSVGAPICVGTNAVYRRAALASAGGFAQIGHSEDVHTGVKILRAGFQVRYVPVVLAKGTCPDVLDSFLTQQYRWCAGSLSLLADRNFHRLPLTLAQRLCFFSGFGYYLSTAFFVLVMPAPTLVMAWFLPDYVRSSNYVWLIPTFLLYPLTVLLYRSRWGLHVLRVQIVYSYAHVVATWHTMRRRPAEWVPTGAAVPRTSVAGKIRALMSIWIVACQLMLWVGISVSLERGYTWLDFSAMIVLGALNLAIVGPILALAHPRLAALAGRAVRRLAPQWLVSAARATRAAVPSSASTARIDTAGRPDPAWLDGRDEVEVVR